MPLPMPLPTVFFSPGNCQRRVWASVAREMSSRHHRPPRLLSVPPVSPVHLEVCPKPSPERGSADAHLKPAPPSGTKPRSSGKKKHYTTEPVSRASNPPPLEPKPPTTPKHPSRKPHCLYSPLQPAPCAQAHTRRHVCAHHAQCDRGLPPSPPRKPHQT